MKINFTISYTYITDLNATFIVCLLSYYNIEGTQWRSWLRHYATGQKVAGSSVDEVIGFFNLPNPFSRTMAPWVGSASNRNEYQKSS
jgi:hypothetical protein